MQGQNKLAALSIIVTKRATLALLAGFIALSLFSNVLILVFKPTSLITRSRETTVEQQETEAPADNSGHTNATIQIKSQPKGAVNDAPIQWPQTDLTIRNAVQLGEVVLSSVAVKNTTVAETPPWKSTTLPENHSVQSTGYTYEWQGKQYEAPIPGLATVVSGFYDLSKSLPRSQSWWNGSNRTKSGKHEVNEYRTWLRNLFAMTDPLVFFCEPDSVWEDMVRTHRQHAPTVVVTVPFEQLPTVTSFTPSFWQTAGIQRDPQQGLRYVRAKDPRLYQIWNAKIIFVHEAALVNPFDTELFVWIDAGYFRSEPIDGVVVRNNITKNGVSGDQMIFQNALPKEEGYLIAAGVFGGTSDAVHLFYENYWKTFWFMVSEHYHSSIGMEQYVLVHMCKSFPNRCSVQESEHWFQLGQAWLRNPSYNFVLDNITLDPTSPARLPGGQNPRLFDMPLVSEPVDLPQKFPIHWEGSNSVR